jgi:hypothetical protein
MFMNGTVAALLTAALCLTACGPKIAVRAPGDGDLSSEAILIQGAGPPPGPEGTCWANDLTPAMFETVTEQTLVTAEVRDAAGTVTTPATYRSVSRVRVLNERRDIWFTAPCPRDMDLAFIATLQRALKARGYYTLAVTGEMNATTTEAIRRYQADRGLDSPILSLAATRQLGLTTTVPE